MNLHPKIRASTLPSHKSHPANLDGTLGRNSSGSEFCADERRDHSNDGIIFSITKTLAAATADEALAVVGVSHPNFCVSANPKLDVGYTSTTVSCDDSDISFTPDPLLTQRAIERTQFKIKTTREQLRNEQASRDENVNEFLKLCSNADRHQQVRMKLLFEKKNQKSAQSIAQLQKKLDEYQKKLKILEEGGYQQKSSHKMRNRVQGLKNVGGNIRDTVMSKPKALAHRLRHRFGSADDLNNLEMSADKDSAIGSLSGSHFPPRKSHLSGIRKPSFEEKALSEDGALARRLSGDASEKSDTTSESNRRESHQHTPAVQREKVNRAASAEWSAVMEEINLHKEEVDRLREEIEESRCQFKREIEMFVDQLHEERERYDHLEEQMNDLTELHQHEIENISSGVKDMEEKVQYQSHEKLLDIQENIQALETKLTSIEHQQAQQQQYINLEGLDSSDSKVVFMKLLTAVITVIHICLFFVGTSFGVVKPLFKTKFRISMTILVVFVSVFIRHQQDNVVGLWNGLTHRFSSPLTKE